MSTYSKYPAPPATVALPVSIANGGTGATSAPAALTALNAANRSLTNLVAPVAPNLRIGLVSGTEPSPALSFQADLTTGLYLSNPAELSISSGGFQVLKIEPAGFNNAVFAQLVNGYSSFAVSPANFDLASFPAYTNPFMSISPDDGVGLAGYTAVANQGLFSTANVFLLSHNGPIGTPTATQSMLPISDPATDNALGVVKFAGYDGTQYLVTSAVMAQATENWVPGTANGTCLTFFGTPTGSFSSAENWMQLIDRGVVIRDSGAIVPKSSSALLQGNSTSKGFLPPRMTTTQKNAISSPAAGLIVFDTTLAKLCVYSGVAWQTITSV